MKWLHQLQSCPSTNTWAIEHKRDLHHGDVVFTPKQTAGRGQQGRSWYSPEGVLTASFILDDLPVNRLTGLSLAVGLAVIYAVEDLACDLKDQLRLKWPNDVMFSGRKLAGILCEATSKGTYNTRVVVGLGLNLRVDFAQAGLDVESVGNPISLHQICSVVPQEMAILERLRHYLLSLRDICQRGNKTPQLGTLEAFLPELQKRDFLLHRSIVIVLATEKISGQAVGIDSWGRLLLQTPQGEIRDFNSARVIDWGKERKTR